MIYPGTSLFKKEKIPYAKLRTMAAVEPHFPKSTYGKNNYNVFLNKKASAIHEFGHDADVKHAAIDGESNFQRAVRNRTPLIPQSKTPYNKGYYDYLTGDSHKHK
jgi:hypothetical protein